jgi:protein-disulfide isomerase
MSDDPHAPKLTLPVGTRDHSQGPPEAPVTLVEYGDYECPYCGAAYPIVKQVQEELGTNLQFVFRNFPLENMHPHAALAAEAAEAAGAEGRFWEMHDALYEHQDALGKGDLVGYARRIGITGPKFSTALANHTFAGRVREDFMSGVRSGVNGTPTFYINGVRHNGSYEFEVLRAAVARAVRTRSK